MGFASYDGSIIERFLQATEPAFGDGVGTPPAHCCPFCHEPFEGYDGLLDHLAELHRGDRLILLLAGREPNSRDTIREKLHKTQILVKNCTTVRARINGNWITKNLSPRNLPALLAKQIDSVVDLQLSNRYDKVAAPVNQRYHLRINAPPKRALDDVDRAFIKFLAISAPTMQQVKGS
jgi:hypothetical protein